jgi:hypothetical protein
MQALYTPRWLHQQLTDDNLLVVDCRFAPNNPALGEEQYRHEQGGCIFIWSVICLIKKARTPVTPMSNCTPEAGATGAPMTSR